MKEITPSVFSITTLTNNISFGTITANQDGNKNIILTYENTSKITDKVKKVLYTVRLIDGNSSTSGIISLEDPTSSIFTIVNINSNSLRLNIDLTNSSNQNFNLIKGKSYLINTQYYDENNNLIEDYERGNNLTTNLNL